MVKSEIVAELESITGKDGLLTAKEDPVFLFVRRHHDVVSYPRYRCAADDGSAGISDSQTGQ